MQIFKNLSSYQNILLHEININNSIYVTHKSFRPSIIFAFSFGAEYDKNSINSELFQSVVAARKCFGKNLPAIVQSEIKSSGSLKDCYEMGENYLDEEKSLFLPKNDLDTWKISQLFVKKSKEQNLDLSSVLYVAHPAHIQRVLMVGEKQMLKGCPFVKKQMPWSVNDKQMWTKSCNLWIQREILTRIFYKLKGQI